MAYNEDVTDRIREILRRKRGITETKMFGGIAFMVNGNMACGVLRDEMHVRLGEQGVERALQRKHVRPFDLTGRPMKNYVTVDAPGYKSKRDLERLVLDSFEFAKSLPKK